LPGSARESHIDWKLTEEAFAKFLACLDPDSAPAGEKYEALREALVKFMDWRGALFTEELVDEILNRVTWWEQKKPQGCPRKAPRSEIGGGANNRCQMWGYRLTDLALFHFSFSILHFSFVIAGIATPRNGKWKMKAPASPPDYLFAAALIAGVYIRSVYSLTIRRALNMGAEVRIASLTR
jgi:hypothetical protein